MALSHYTRFVLLLGGLVVVLFILSMITTPTSFGRFGYYRGDNVQEWMVLNVQLVEANQCLDCHNQEYNRWNVSKHSGISCESCHDTAIEHAKTNESTITVPSDSLCELCHAPSVSRPMDFPQISYEEHWNNITTKGTYSLEDAFGEFDYTCLTCHDPMGVGLVIPQIPHSTEGRSDCRSCHGIEGIKVFPEYHVHRPNDVCQACHKNSEIPQVPHNLEGMEKCIMCHERNSIEPFPENHTGRTDEGCLQCHESE